MPHLDDCTCEDCEIERTGDEVDVDDAGQDVDDFDLELLDRACDARRDEARS